MKNTPKAECKSKAVNSELPHFREVDSTSTSQETSSAELSGSATNCQQNLKAQKPMSWKQFKTWALYMLLLILFLTYIGFAMAHNLGKALPLFITTCCVALSLFYFKVIKVYYGKKFETNIWMPLIEKCNELWTNWIIRWSIYLAAAGGSITFLLIDTANDRYRLVSLGGLCFYLVACFIFSTHPKQVKWRPVIWGIALQFLIGLLVLRWPAGFRVLQFTGEQIEHFMNYAQYGTRFVYGFLAEPPNICNMHPVFAFSVLQTLLYFGSFIALLYYFGVIQFVLFQLAWLMQFTMGTTAAESLNAAGCIFLGMTEGPLLIRPYFAKMTKSELHTVFTSGFACIAGSLFVAYISFGACPVYLLTASVMSAPASISISKLLLPETEESKLKKASDLHLPPSEDKSAIAALSQGATSVIDIIAQILANLVVFTAALAFINGTVGWLGDLVGLELSFEKSLGYLFFPLAFMMGSSDNADWDTRMNETFIVAQLMGTKTFLNEFIAYKDMGVHTANGLLTGRAQMIATFALCGFSNFASIGTQLGTIGALCPEKRPIVSEIIMRSLFAGAVACFTTACVAGLLISDPIKCEPIFSGLKNCTQV